MRGILNTAVDPYAILSRNPCKVPGAGRESPEERPLVTVAQVFDVAERMPDRWSAMVLLAAFGSLRFGEVIALRRGDLAKDASTVRISRAFVDVPGQGLLVGPPKSRAGVRTVIMPHAVRAELLKHLHEFVEPDDEALLFTGKKGLALRRRTSRSSRSGPRWSRIWVSRVCTFTTCATRATSGRRRLGMSAKDLDGADGP
jgi:integrase